jgi:post-segregation antitoxin (ccd killing protein)
MGKVNVYLPDDLEQAVRDAGLSVSPVCQLALRRAVDQVTDLRDRGRGPFTARLDAILGDLRAEAAETGRDVTADQLFRGIVEHADNLGARALTMLGVELPARRPARGRAGTGELAADARDVLAAAFKVSLELRHDRIGTEHVVLAFALPESPLAGLFEVLGIEPVALRRQIERLRANPWSTERSEPSDLFTLERLDAAVQELAAELGRLKDRREG